jgi:hypothetical protein
VRWNEAPRPDAREEETLELDPSQLGTLELDGNWVPLMDMSDEGFVPTRLTMANNEYAFHQSFNTKGYSAVMPDALRALRDAGKRLLVVERPGRYYVFVTPP